MDVSELETIKIGDGAQTALPCTVNLILSDSLIVFYLLTFKSRASHSNRPGRQKK